VEPRCCLWTPLSAPAWEPDPGTSIGFRCTETPWEEGHLPDTAAKVVMPMPDVG
jgi:hypothetical protein